MSDKIITIYIEEDDAYSRGTELFEELEDALANTLGIYGLRGRIDDSITGNTTRFPIQIGED